MLLFTVTYYHGCGNVYYMVSVILYHIDMVIRLTINMVMINHINGKVLEHFPRSPPLPSTPPCQRETESSAVQSSKKGNSTTCVFLMCAGPVQCI